MNTPDKEKALKAIRNAWICGIISAAITLLMTILILSGVNIPPLKLNLLTLIDILFILAMSYGISQKSRVCSTLLFIYFILNKLYYLIPHPSIISWLVALVFIFYFYQGIRGTFRYHKIIKEEKAVGVVKDVP